jgi:shikimate kinase
MTDKDSKTPSGIIFISGFMGVGKTETAVALGKRLKWPVLDTDQLIEEGSGQKISEIFEKEGEEVFRQQESEVIGQIQDNGGHQVVSLGGGAVLNESHRDIFKNHHWVNLNLSFSQIGERLKNDQTRPLAKDVKELQSLFDMRQKYYAEAPVQIECDVKTPDEIADEVLRKLF